MTPLKSKKLNIVVIGGGTGISNLLQGLKQYDCNLSAIVTMFDSGGSSGLLREELGVPPFGDLRQCLMALGELTDETRLIRSVLNYRFNGESSLNGHNVGNLFMAAMVGLNGDLEKAIAETSQILKVQGQVIPVSIQSSNLCAELTSGEILVGESKIDLRKKSFPPIKNIYLDPPVTANPNATNAIIKADAIVIGPGDLYTSILPNLVVSGIPEALALSSATRIYVCNLMTKLGETDNFRASDFVKTINKAIPTSKIDWVIVNTQKLTSSVRLTYEKEGAYHVIADLDTIREHTGGVLASALSTNEVPVRHHPERTAEAVLQAIDAGRLRNTHDINSYRKATLK